MAEAPRAGVDEDRNLVLEQAEGRGASAVMDLRDALHLEEVIAGSERAQLIAPAFARARRYCVSACPRERAALFDRFGIGFARVSGPDRPAQAGVENVVHGAVVEREPPLVADPGRHVALDLRRQRRQMVPDVEKTRATREQPHAAI